MLAPFDEAERLISLLPTDMRGKAIDLSADHILCDLPVGQTRQWRVKVTLPCSEEATEPVAGQAKATWAA